MAKGLFGSEHGCGSARGWRVDQGVRRSGPSGSVATKLSESEGPDGAPLYVWFGRALVRPSRCDLRCSRHACPRCGGRRPTTAGAHGRVGPARAWLPGVRGARGRPRPPDSGYCTTRPASAGSPCIRWLVRIWRCREPAVPTATFTEEHRSGAAADGADGPGGAVGHRCAQPRRHHRVRAGPPPRRRLAHLLGRDRGRSHEPGSLDPARLAEVKTLGVDEHIWRPSRIGVDRAVTIMVDLTRDQAGCLHARLLDAVVGRSGTVYKTLAEGPT